MSHVNDNHNSPSVVPNSRKRKRGASINGDLPNDKLGTRSSGTEPRKRKRIDTIPSELRKDSSSSTSAVSATPELHCTASIRAFFDKCYPDIPHPPSSTWQSSTRNPPSFWDSLSSIKLTSAALDELNRRNKHLPKPVPIALGTDSGVDFDNLPARRGEISAELQRFARVGGPSLTDIRGYTRPGSIDLEEPTSGSVDMVGKRKSRTPSGQANSKKSKSENTTETRNTSPYDDNFMTALLDRHINKPDYDPKPTNFEALKTLMKPKGSSSISDFTEEKLSEFRAAAAKATNEEGVNIEVITKIKDDTVYHTVQTQKCSNWAPLLDKGGLTAAKPDYMDGLEIKSENGFLRSYLQEFIVPAANVPFLPNFFFEAKGPKGTPEIANRQALHDGSLGARGILYTRICAGEKLDSDAYTFSGLFSSGVLKLFAHFITQPDGNKGMLHYHMCILGQWLVENDVDTFRLAVTAFRNLRQHASTVREGLAVQATKVLLSAVHSGKLDEASTYTPTNAPQSLDLGPQTRGSGPS